MEQIQYEKAYFLFSIWRRIQLTLLPNLEDQLGTMTAKEKEFARVAELAQVDKHLRAYRWVGNGRKPHDRKAIALAFIAKALWGLPTTKQLILFLKGSRQGVGQTNCPAGKANARRKRPGAVHTMRSGGQTQQPRPYVVVDRLQAAY